MERSRGRDYLAALAYVSLGVAAVAASLINRFDFDVDFGSHDPAWVQGLLVAAGVLFVMLVASFFVLPGRQPSHGLCLFGLLVLLTGCLAAIMVAMLLFHTWIVLPSCVFLLSLTLLFAGQCLRLLPMVRTDERKKNLPRPTFKQWLAIALLLLLLLPALKLTLRLEDSARNRRPWRQGDPVEKIEPTR